MIATVKKSRDPHYMGGRVRYDGLVTTSDGQFLFSIGYYRGRTGKARAQKAAEECLARYIATGDWLERKS